MRIVLLLLLAMLAIKTTTTTSAVGQPACQKNYIGCLDKCVGRPTPQLQETCMGTCQTQNNACFSQVYGAPGPNAVTVKEEAPKGAAPRTEAPRADMPNAENATAEAEQPPAPAAKPKKRVAAPKSSEQRRQ